MIQSPCDVWTSCGISPGFPRLSPTRRQVGHVLLTRPPLGSGMQAPQSSLDLHVLGTPPAFVLSQDQTLRWKVLCGSANADLADRSSENLRSKPTRARSAAPARHSARRSWARPPLSKPRFSISRIVPYGTRIAGSDHFP